MSNQMKLQIPDWGGKNGLEIGTLEYLGSHEIADSKEFVGRFLIQLNAPELPVWVSAGLLDLEDAEYGHSVELLFGVGF